MAKKRAKRKSAMEKALSANSHLQDVSYDLEEVMEAASDVVNGVVRDVETLQHWLKGSRDSLDKGLKEYSEHRILKALVSALQTTENTLSKKAQNKLQEAYDFLGLIAL